uniref:Uncharacterized protein n=1 Tax=Oryza sativa subsp. japonica TaxID=39947 RepID=Q7F1B3_ORYSJ|nr:hypothetical protein [Oryza sativa Japonica Group]
MEGFGWIEHGGPFFMAVWLEGECGIGRPRGEYSPQMPDEGIRVICPDAASQALGELGEAGRVTPLR